MSCLCTRRSTRPDNQRSHESSGSQRKHGHVQLHVCLREQGSRHVVHYLAHQLEGGISVFVHTTQPDQIYIRHRSVPGEYGRVLTGRLPRGAFLRQGCQTAKPHARAVFDLVLSWRRLRLWNHSGLFQYGRTPQCDRLAASCAYQRSFIN